MINFRMRKFFARLALPFVTAWLITAPGQAFGVLPLFVLGATSGTATVTTSVSVATGALLTTFGLGAAFEHFTLTDTSTGVTSRIPLTASIAVPAPSAPSSATQTPSSSVYMYGYGLTYIEGVNYLPDPLNGPQQACANLGGTYFASQQQCSMSAASCTLIGYTSGCYDGIIRNKSTKSITTPASCPSGYTVNGTSCVLSNSRAVTPDNNCDVKRTGSSYYLYDADSDCAPTGNSPAQQCAAAGINCTIGADINGTPALVKITPQASGGSDVQIQVQRTSGGTSVVDTTNISVDASGKVSGVSGGTNAGNLSVDGSGNLTANLGSGVSPSDSSFPSDYVRSTDVQNLAGTLGGKLDGINDKLSISTEVGDPVEPAAADMPGWGSTFSGLTGWQLPAHASTCPTPSVDLSGVLGAGSVYTFDAHCGLIQDHFNALQAAMMLVWTILGVMIVLRA